ncbi:MAG: adenylate cyclase, partial [Gammaproteobacteria bacterium]
MRISVGLKVFSIAIISLVMMASTGLYSVWKLHEVARESDVVAKVYLALVESAGDIDKHVLEQEILIERMRLLTRVPYQEGERAAQIEAALLAFDTRGEQAGVAIKVAGRLLDYAVTRDPSVESAYEASTIRAHLQQVDRERMDFTRHARRLVGFALEGREDARAAFAEMLDEQEGEFDRSVAELRQRVTSFAHGAAEQARDDAADLERHSLILILIATTVGLLLSAVVSIGLIRPMRRLLMGIRDVRGGDLDTHVAVRSRDEVGELSTGFNEMTAGLKAKEQIKSIFGNYLDPRIVDQLI